MDVGPGARGPGSSSVPYQALTAAGGVGHQSAAGLRAARGWGLVSEAAVRSSAAAMMGLPAERAASPVVEAVAEPGFSCRAKAVDDIS